MMSATRIAQVKHTLERTTKEYTIRNFQGPADFEAITRVLGASRNADGLDEARTVEQIAEMYANMKNFEATRDLFLVEAAGELIAYAGTRWWQETDLTFTNALWIFVLPEWRSQGIERELLQRAHARMETTFAQHPRSAPTRVQLFVAESQQWLADVLKTAGYQPARYFYDMVRPHLENIPDAELPHGIQVRPVEPEHWHSIWQANVEAFREHWGEQLHTEDDYARWLKMPRFNPALWQVAWDSAQVVGMVLNFVDEEENEKFHRKRGYTEDICVLKPWRGRGIARALIIRSLRMFRDLGYDSTGLGVDSENADGALRLYESVGYETERTVTVYRKAI